MSKQHATPARMAPIQSGLTEGVSGTAMLAEDDSLVDVWLESERFTGTIGAEPYLEGLKHLDAFSSQLQGAVSASAAPSLAVLEAALTHDAVRGYDPGSVRTHGDACVSHLAAAEAGVQAEVDGSRYWWAESAEAASDATSSLQTALDGALAEIPGLLRLPGEEESARLVGSDAVARRVDVLEGAADAARRARVAGAANTALPLDRQALADLAALVGELPAAEADLAFRAVEGSGAHPLFLGHLARDLGRPLPAFLAGMFADPEAAQEAWEGQQGLVLDMVGWETGDEVTQADLERFEAALRRVRDTGSDVPRMTGDGLSEALSAAADVYDTRFDDTTAGAARRRCVAALDRVLERYAEVSGADAILASITSHRDDLDRLGARAEAVQTVDELSGGSEDAGAVSIDEAAVTRSLRRSAKELVAARRDIAGKFAELAATGAEMPQKLTGSLSLPASAGGVSAKVIAAIAEADSLDAMLEEVGGDKPPSGLETSVAFAKTAKAVTEAIVAYGAGLTHWAAVSAADLGLADDAARWAEASQRLGDVGGKALAVVGVCISVAELASAIRDGDEEKIAGAAASLAQSGISAGEAFGLLSAEAGIILNVLVIEVYGAYEIARGLPEIAKAAAREDVRRLSNGLSRHYKAAHRDLTRARAAYLTMTSGAADATLQQELHDICAHRLRSHQAHVKNAFVHIGDAPPALRDAFDAQLDRTASVYQDDPPSLDQRGRLMAWFSSLDEEAVPMRRGMEDLLLEAEVLAGTVSPMEAAVTRAVRTAERG